MSAVGYGRITKMALWNTRFYLEEVSAPSYGTLVLQKQACWMAFYRCSMDQNRYSLLFTIQEMITEGFFNSQENEIYKN